MSRSWAQHYRATPLTVLPGAVVPSDMMNPETTAATVTRAVLARRASEALDRVACAADRRLERHAGGYGLSDAKLEVL